MSIHKKAFTDLNSTVSFGGGGGGGGNSRNTCTARDPYGTRNQTFVGPAPTPSAPNNSNVSAICNLGRSLSAAGQAQSNRGGRAGAIGAAVGIIGEVTASVACPASGTTSW